MMIKDPNSSYSHHTRGFEYILISYTSAVGVNSIHGKVAWLGIFPINVHMCII